MRLLRKFPITMSNCNYTNKPQFLYHNGCHRRQHHPHFTYNTNHIDKAA
jgi:hypothetical protein